MNEENFIHKIFGLALRSNLPIPGVPPAQSPPDHVDVELHLGASPYLESEIPDGSESLTYVSSYTDGLNNPALRIWRTPDCAFLHLIYHDGIQFWLDCGGNTVWAVWPETSALADAASYLLGPVLGLLLRTRGVTCLHASAVSIEDYSVVFVGSAGAGKSTTAAAFARKGYSVISDDIVALEDRRGTFHVVPAYPYLCLWPDSVQMLYGSSEALPRIIPSWDKRQLALGDQRTRFEKRPLPLGAIYILGERSADASPFVESIQPRVALLSLVAETYANKIIDREMRGREFTVLGHLVTTVPIRRVRPSNDPARLEELCRVIHEDFAALKSPAAAQP